MIIIAHSSGSIPASVAARGLSKAERVLQGKTTAVLGQTFIAALLPRGGDGRDVVATFGGELPAHIRVDVGGLGDSSVLMENSFM